MPPDLVLDEWETLSAVSLEQKELDVLGRTKAVSVVPSRTPGCHDLSSQSTIGVLDLGKRALRIEPKVPIDRVLFLLSYALDPVDWQQRDVAYDVRDDLVGAMAAALASAMRSALRTGLLQGYRHREETALTIRGRIRFSEQLRRHPGRSYPIEIGYDDFTTDIDENRLLLAALWRLRHIQVTSDALRNELAHQRNVLAEAASLVDYRGIDLPSISWTALNRRYRPAVSLARLVLRATTVEQGRGLAESAGFLVNMNVVFEEFVRAALRQELGLGARSFPAGNQVGLHLDERRRIGLDPDLSWWHAGRCRFVGDVKYKRLRHAGIKHPDLYQLLSYVVATDLPGGLLVYPVAERDHTAEHEVVHLGRRLDVMTIDLSGTPDEILASVSVVADRVRELAAEAGRPKALVA